MNNSTLVPRSWRRSLFNSSTLRLSLGLFLIWLIILGQNFAGFLTKDGRLAEGLRGHERVDVVAVLDFDPERYHNEQLARYGVFSGRDGNIRRFRLRSVSPDNLEALAELIWISRIEPMQ